MRHLTSFARSPIGYLANLIATCTGYTGCPAWLDAKLCTACELFCLRDGVQDDPMF